MLTPPGCQSMPMDDVSYMKEVIKVRSTMKVRQISLIKLDRQYPLANSELAGLFDGYEVKIGYEIMRLNGCLDDQILQRFYWKM